MSVLRVPLAQPLKTTDGIFDSFGVPVRGTAALNGVIDRNPNFVSQEKVQIRKRKPLHATTMTYVVLGSTPPYSNMYVDTRFEAAVGAYYTCFTDAAGGLYLEVINGAGIGPAYPVPGLIASGYSGSTFCVSQEVSGIQTNVYVYAANSNGFDVYTVHIINGVVTVLPKVSMVTDTVSSFTWFDNYVFVGTTTGKLYNTDYQDYGLASTADFLLNMQIIPDVTGITAMANNGNYLLVASLNSVFVYQDTGNPTGSVVTLYKEATLPYGATSLTRSPYGVVFGAAHPSPSGIYMVPFNGVQAQKISDESIDLLNVANSTFVFVVQYGRPFVFVLPYVASATSYYAFYAYDVVEGVWQPYSIAMSLPASFYWGAANVFYPASGAVASYVYPAILTVTSQALSLSDTIYNSESAVWTDSIGGVATDYPLIVQTYDSDNDNRQYKFYGSALVAGQQASASAPVTVQYSDDGGQTLSSSLRMVDMSLRKPVTYQLGRSLGRIWRLTYNGNLDMRLTALEFTLT